MNLKVIITLIATVVWFGIGWRYYTCHIKGFCGDNSSISAGDPPSATTTSTDSSEESQQNKYPLSFKWGSIVPEKGADFDAYMNALLADTVDGKSLTITGQHFAGEGNSQLGIERAKQIRLLLADYFDTNRIYVSEELLETDSSQNGRFFEAAQFSWKTVDQSIIERIGNELIIYFPYKSTQRIADSSIDEIFEDLVTEIKQKNLGVELVGHTDNIGPDDYNIDLGQNRAEAIKDLFVSKGLDTNSIKISSKGEAESIGDNSTESGRRKNRRVEILIK